MSATLLLRPLFNIMTNDFIRSSMGSFSVTVFWGAMAVALVIGATVFFSESTPSRAMRQRNASQKPQR